MDELVFKVLALPLSLASMCGGQRDLSAGGAVGWVDKINRLAAKANVKEVKAEGISQ